MSYAYKKGNDDDNYPYESSDNLTRTDTKNRYSGRRTILIDDAKNKSVVSEIKVIKPQIKIQTHLTKNKDFLYQ